MAASAVSSTKDAERAICRLVEETSGHKKVRLLGPGCLVKFENTQFLHSVGTPKSKYFLVSSKEVLAIDHLEALEKQQKKRRTHEPSVKIVAEFPGLKNRGTLDRKPLSEFYLSIKGDLFELHGITYVALTKWEQRRFGKSSLLSRALEVVSTEGGSSSSLLTSDQLQCLVFCGESTSNTQDRNVYTGELSTRVYDLLKSDSVLTPEESQVTSYFLRNEENKRFLKENAFKKDEKPFGSVILTKDNKLAGVLNFLNNNPAPVIVGGGFDTGICSHTQSSQGAVAQKAGEKHDVTEREFHAGASGGMYPFLGLQSKSEVGIEPANKTDMSTLSQPAVTPSTGNDQFVAGLRDENQSGESLADPGAIYPLELTDVHRQKEVQEKDQGFASGRPSPTENSCRFSSFNKTNQDLKGPVFVVGLPPENSIEEEPPDRVEVPADQLGHQNGDQSPPANNGEETPSGGVPADQIRPQNGDQRPPANNSSGAPPGQVPADQYKHQKEDQRPPANNNEEVPPVQVPADQYRHEKEDQRPPANNNEEVPPVPVPADQLRAHADGALPQNRPRDHSPQGRGTERRRSFPFDAPKKEEQFPQVKRTTSDLSQLQSSHAGGQRKFQLGDPLTETLLDCLNLLEASSRCLDQEYRYGHCKCWKHVAEFFKIPEKDYKDFNCNQVHSPTEVMFEFLQTDNPDIKVGVLKDALAQIERHDVIAILMKHEKTKESSLNNETLVCSLFDSDPDIIGEMSFLLDKQKLGLKDWSHLAGKLGVARTTFKSFETCSTDNPTKDLFNILKIRFPKLTVGELIGHLEGIKRRDVISAINKSTKVTERSFIKELVADLGVMDNVCELLNKRQRTSKVLGLKHLGYRFDIEEEVLDVLLPEQEETVSPTEALIRHLGGRKPWLTLADFIWALHTIERNDVLAVLDVYLTDGCIPNLLKSCACKTCKVKQSEEDQ